MCTAIRALYVSQLTSGLSTLEYGMSCLYGLRGIVDDNWLCTILLWAANAGVFLPKV
jgi:hypothetical protein